MAAIKDEKEDNKTGKMLALFDIIILLRKNRLPHVST